MKIILVLLLFISAEAMAIQKAYVKKTKALIYSDEKLTSPIGWVRKGKELSVGENPRKYGTILPIIVSGRIGFIQIDDIVIKDDFLGIDLGTSGHTEHKLQHIQEDEDILTENNYFIFSYAQFSGGAQWEEMSNSIDNDGQKSFSHYQLTFEHRPKIYKFFYGFGGGLISNTTQDVAFEAYTFELSGGRELLRPSEMFTLDFFGALSMSAAAQIKVKDSEQVHEGQIFGWQVGLQSRIFPEDQLGFLLGFSYEVVNLFGFPDINLPTASTDYNLKGLSGFNFSMGFHYKF